jgi:hypothetical protein
MNKRLHTVTHLMILRAACAETSNRRMFGTVYLERTWVRIGYDTCCRQVAQRRLGTGSYISDWKELDPGLE